MPSWSRAQLTSFAAQGATQRRETTAIAFTHAAAPYAGSFTALRASEAFTTGEPGGLAGSRSCTLRVDLVKYPGFAPLEGDLITRHDDNTTLRIASIAKGGLSPEIVITLSEITT